MAATQLAETDFIRLFEEIGPSAMARRCGLNVRNLHRRRKRIEAKIGRRLDCPEARDDRPAVFHPHRIELEVYDGTVIVGSDAHYWPGTISVAHRAFARFAKELKPQAIIMNGDAFDGASISRHPPIGWARQPTVQEEIETCQDRLDEIVKASPGKCRKIWSLGNHDARFETRIAQVAPELAKVAGTSLNDHFPLWESSWSTWINGDVVVKHRFRGGVHAQWNNTIHSGKTIITGHLHSAKVTPFTDYNGTRYGVDTGCLADIYGPQFVGYTEDNPRNWVSAFCVLTFKGGRLLWPELVVAFDDEHVQFRGEIIKV